MRPAPRRELQSFEGIALGLPIAWARTATVEDRNNPGKLIRVNQGRYRGWKKTAAEVFQARARWRQFPGEVSVVVDVFADRVEVRAQALDPADRRRPGALRADIDNYAKAALDALVAAEVLADDRDVVEITVRMHPERSQ